MGSEAPDAIKRVTRAGDNFYKILGVEKGASEDEIKKAYRKLALRLHPDKCKDAGAEDAFKKVGEAFSVLSDSEKRQTYDQFGADGLRHGGGGRGGGPDISPDDLFAAFFGGQPGMSGFNSSGMGGGRTFVRTGNGSFVFSSAGVPGGFSFSSGGPAGMRQRRAREDKEEERETEKAEIPSWMLALQGLAGGLGPLLPFAVLAGLAFLFMAFLILMQRLFYVLPIMYMTEGRTKLIMLGTIVLGAMLGIL